MDIILLAGLWLPRTVWADVETELERLGHRPLSVALTGADDGSTTATLDDQVATALAAVDATERPLVVGHSAASGLAWMVADRRPDRIAGVVLVGGFPTSDGARYADFFPVVDGVMPFPGWEPFDGPDTADLDEATRRRLADLTVAVPAGVSMAEVHLGDERRHHVPTLLVCPEYTPAQVKAWIDEGDLPELAAATQLSLVDLDSGHWPMVTRPAELARLLHDATTGA